MSQQTVHAGRSVNSVIVEHPQSVQVFNALGVDACCGGAAPLDVAARDAGVAPAELLAALRSALGDVVVPMEHAAAPAPAPEVA